MKNLPPNEQLLAFKLVAELGSFTSAANSLNISQSAVSHQISRLEKRLGFRLISRSSHSMMLTDEGERYYSAIAYPISLLLDALETLGEPIGASRLGIQVEAGFSAAWLSPRLHKFFQANPHIQVDQRRASSLSFSGGVELAIKWGMGNWPHFDSELLLKVEYSPLCAPSLIGKTGPLVVPDDLRNYTLLHDRTYSDWQSWLELAGTRSVNGRRGHIADDVNILINLAIAGEGIALSSPRLAQHALRAGLLVMPFPDTLFRPTEAYQLVTKKGVALSARAEAFATWIKEEAALDISCG